MRLLNVHTLQFREFHGNVTEKYVVASHRWSLGHEAMIEDVMSKCNTEESGYKKVEGFARFVRERICYVDWLWIDTCCVNQGRDREVSEAVNSMFRWYSRAELCLAYLVDVDDAEDVDQFRRSDWFRRGWTLQELLAPDTVVFLSQDWRVIGHKGGSGRSQSGLQVSKTSPLESTISIITDIPESVLHSYEESKNFTIEERLRWIAGRQTTCEEDMSYSLFGLFDVALPLIYGEGAKKARRRLLKEIAESADLERSGTGNRSNGHPAIRTEMSLQAPQVQPAKKSNIDEQGNYIAKEMIAIGSPRCRLHHSSRRDEAIVQSSADKASQGSIASQTLVLNIVNEAAERGRKAFDNEDYEEADARFQEAQALATELPEEQYSKDDSLSVRLRLAVCAFYVHDKAVAESALLNVIQRSSNSRVNDNLRYEAPHLSHISCRVLHLLSQIYITKGDLDLARSACEEAYDGRRQLGPRRGGSKGCRESLALLSTIYELQGNAQRAKLVLNMIPGVVRRPLYRPLHGAGVPGMQKWCAFVTLSPSSGLDAAPVRSLAFSADGRKVASGDFDGRLCVWDAVTFRTIVAAANNVHRDRACFSRLSFSLNGREVIYLAPKGKIVHRGIAAAGEEHAADLVDPLLTHTFLDNKENPYIDAAFSLSGEQVAFIPNTTKWDKPIRLYNVTTGRRLATFRDQEEYIHTFTFSPDGKEIASVSGGRSLVLWDIIVAATVQDKELAKKSARLDDECRCIAFSPDGKLIALAMNDNTIRIWDVGAWQEIANLPPADGGITISLAISSDSTPVASVSKDGTIILWNISARKGIALIEAYESGGEITCAAFSPNGKKVAVGSQTGTVTLWDLPWDIRQA